MEILELCRKIQMPEAAVRRITQLDIPEEEYQQMNCLRREDYDIFCGKIKNKKDFRILFLYYFCRFACETYDDYKREQISEQIFFDTFSDLRHWCDNCYQEFGEYGIDEYTWFWRLFDQKIYKLGRLQFECSDASCIQVHIPQGEPLDWEACKVSFEKAYDWFGGELPYVCDSWLLFPGLKEILPGQSNIIIFQNHFDIQKINYEARDAERRIFSKVRENPKEYQEDTSLQRRAKEYLLAGKKLGTAYGIYRPEI